MPAKNIVKQYLEDSYYHLYNRGVAKMPIFLDDQDYHVFLKNLSIYLTPPPAIQGATLFHLFQENRLKNYAHNTNLVAYCLMPNHYHLLIHQTEARAIADFMRSLITKYVIYFNNRYDRIGPLFQSAYKAVRVESDEQLLHLTRYIHRNPNPETDNFRNLQKYPYSSLNYYINPHTAPSWQKTNHILSYFSTQNPNQTYQSFVAHVEDQGYFPQADE